MSEQQFLWNSLDGGENVFIKERGSDKIIHIKIIEGKYEFVDFMEKVNEQQSIINCLRQKKIKERKFVLDEEGIVEKISNESYPRINSDEKDNPVRTLSCSNLFELVNLLNEQQAEIERLRKQIQEKD